MEIYWDAISNRDTDFDGKIVYAVKTTGIYCKPSCPSRKPKRENVVFFNVPHLAEAAGYRPCKRCAPTAHIDPQIEQMEAICRYIEDNLEHALTLDHLSDEFALSPFHLQRTFKDIVGISPQQYTEALRLQQIRSALGNGENIIEAIYAAGYSSTSKLYTCADMVLGMTPGTYQQGGADMHILYTIVDCSLGKLLVAATERGLCAVRLGEDVDVLETALMQEFLSAGLERDSIVLTGWVNEILAYIEGKQPNLALPLDVQATAFQRQVWQALQEVPYGETRTYADIAKAIGRPTASRAVANAIGSNPVAMVIPCHRIIRSDGGLGGYRWGIDRKEALLVCEQG
jgi:AraC family transcriptional regulator of adaptative response/methylated-DNA-[protein]-cysteine methyltransferase